MKRFEKNLELSGLVIYLLKRVWIVIIVIALFFGISVLMDRKETGSRIETSKTGGYKCAFMLHVNSEELDLGSAIGMAISYDVLSEVIDDFELEEKYTDLCSMMKWKIYGMTYQLILESASATAINGQDWVSIMEDVEKRTIKKTYDLYRETSIVEIDAPCIIEEPQMVTVEIANQKINVYVAPLAAAMISIILILLYYIFNTRITQKTEIEKNLDIPVILELPKENVSKLSNIIANNVGFWKNASFIDFDEGGKSEGIVKACSEDLSSRLGVKEIELQALGCIYTEKDAAFIAGKSSKTVVVIGHNKVNGNKAISYVDELRLNGADVFGAIYVG